MAAPEAEKAADPLVSALRTLRKQYKEEQPAALAAFAALEACGFHPDDSNEFLVMDADYARTQGLRLRDAQRKVELLLDELASAGF
eukprot:g633.t1